MMESEVVLAIVGILGSCVALQAWIIRYMFQKIVPVLESLKDSNDKLVKSTDRNTQATAKADEYLRNRNGRDAKVHEQVLASIRELAGAKSK